MARQIKNGSSWKQEGKGKMTLRTGLFDIVKDIFGLNRSKLAAKLSPYIPLERVKNSGVAANQTGVSATEAQLRRIQMLQ